MNAQLIDLKVVSGDSFLSMSTLDILLTLAAACAAIAITFAFTVKISRIIISRRSAKADDNATIDQSTTDTGGGDNISPRTGDGSVQTTTIVNTGGGDYHEAAQQQDPEPKRPAELSPKERELLSLIEPGGYFVVIKTLSKHCVVYGMPKGPLTEFLDRDDPMVATAYIENLQSLVSRGLIKKDKDKYNLTVKGDTRRTLMLSD